MEDMTDKAIGWIGQQKALIPDKPFFVYFAPGATHAPHHVPKEWADKYKGKFDAGWDKLREETFARQKKLGVIPADCQLTARHKEIPAWDDMPEELKPVLRRQMEVYAGFLEYTDHHVGRLLDTLKKLQIARRHARLLHHRRQRRVGRGHAERHLQRDDQLQRRRRARDAGIPDGAARQARRARVLQPLRRGLGARDEHALPVDQAGRLALGRHAQRHDRPLAEGHQGEGRDPHAVPPRHRRRADDPRSGRTARSRSSVNGVQQKPIEGVSMLYSFNDAKAAERHETQYFEMFGNRGIYHKGWTAVTRHKTPWLLVGEKVPAFDDDVWELYDTTKDWSQANNLAKQMPEKLHELQRLWLIEATRYNVLPLDDRVAERFNPDLAGRPVLIKGKTQILFGGMGRLSENSVVNIKNKSHSVTAEIDVPASGAEGVIIAQGGNIGGWALYAKGGKLKYCYNLLGIQHFYAESEGTIPAGEHQVRMEFAYDGGGLGKGGTATLFVDGKKVGEGQGRATAAMVFSADDGCDVGRDTGSPVSPDYGPRRQRVHGSGQGRADRDRRGGRERRPHASLRRKPCASRWRGSRYNDEAWRVAVRPAPARADDHRTDTVRKTLSRIAPGLAMLSGYRREWLRSDIAAGLSVAAVAIPVAIAYSQLAGGDAALYTSLAIALAGLMGVACVLAGFLRLGFLADFLGKPVLVGFMNGIAISIVLGQLGKVFGFAIESGRISPPPAREDRESGVCCRRYDGCSNKAERSSGLARTPCFRRSARRSRRASVTKGCRETVRRLRCRMATRCDSARL